MLHRLTLSTSAALALLFLASCTSGSTPTAPTGTAATPNLATLQPQEGALIGAFDVALDLERGTAELVPVREATAVGDTYSELGLGPAFTELFGRNFGITGLRHLGGGQVDVDLSITHPFSPAIRPDLAIFNLKAWAVSDRPSQPIGTLQTVPDFVTNADGYGQMWQDTASTLPGFTAASIQPYILMREDPGTGTFDFQNPAGYNVFFPGMTSEATLALNLESATQVSLRLYLTADYGQSAVRATRQTPAYELPKFAGNAAWKVAVTELSNDLEATVTSSTAAYQVDIWDWKHGAGLGSDVATATIEIPGVTASPISFALTGTGADPTPLTGQTVVTNVQGALEGTYWGLVTVTDEATSGIGLKEDLTTPVAFTSYITYQTIAVPVETTVVFPDAVLTRCYGGDMKPGIGDTFSGSTSIPGTLPILTYEWDWDYIAPAFDVDATGINATHTYSTAGTYTVGLRVTDTDGHADVESVVVNVTGTPTWNATQRLTTNAVYEQYQGFGSNQTNALAQTADGTVHLVYPVVTGTFPAYTFEHYHVQYTGCPPSWSTPVLISSTTNSNNFQWNVSLAASGNTLHAAYTGPSESSGYPEFRHATYDGSTWTITGKLTNYISPGQTWTGGYLASRPDGAIAFAGKRRIAGTCPGIPGPPMPVYFASWNGTTWSPLTQIGDRNIVLTSSACGSYSLSDEDMSFVGTADNEWMAVWATVAQQYDGFTAITSSYTEDLKFNRTTGGVWGTQAVAYPTVGRNPNPVLRRAPDGVLWLATGVQPNASSNIGIGLYNGTSWLPMTTVRTQIGSEAFFTLGFEPGGNAMLLYSHNQASNYLNYVTFPQTLSPVSIAPLPGVAVEPGSFARVGHQVFGLADGRFIAVWETDKYGGGPFSAREVDSSTWQ